VSDQAPTSQAAIEKAIKRATKTGWNQGLEEAAKVCDARADFDSEHASALEYAATLIRGMKS
jgi:hypothetical protein